MFNHLYEIVQRRAVELPDATALGSQRGLIWETLTSRELLDRVDGLAAQLVDRGVQAGDRVVLWVPSTWWAPVYHFAIWKLGGIVVPFDREMNPEAARRIVEVVEPRSVIVGYHEQPDWADGSSVSEWWEPPRAPATERQQADWTAPAEELAVVAFTSGTTGQPKGCMITHANLCSQVNVLGDNIPLGPDCRLASILPLSHLFELTGGLLYPLSTGAEIHYVPSRRGPDIVRVLSDQRITHMIAVPQLFTIMGRALEEQLASKLPTAVVSVLRSLAERLPLERRRLIYWMVHRQLGGHLRMLAAGGAALPPETQLLWERLGVRMVQGYGTSECSPVVACGAPDGSTPLGSVGRAIRDVEVRLGDGGELEVRGPNVMRGYWRDPDKTAEVIQGGWYRTGDLASIDERGNITLSGRAKDLIVLPSGLNVWPEDVENTLRAEVGVKDATVIPIPTAAGGATLHAYLLPVSRSAPPDISRIIDRANARLAMHQHVATASWWSEPDFPRTPTLKVRRHLLPLPENVQITEFDVLASAEDPVAQVVASAARVPAVRDDQQLAELGLDSLGLVDLALALEEKTGRVVADSDLRLDMTVSDVREAVGKAPRAGSEAAGAAGLRGVEPPLWPYSWGRAFRALAFPFDLIYRFSVTRTVVLGGEHLATLGPRVLIAGTHHSFADLHLVRHGLKRSAAPQLADRLVIAASAANLAEIGPSAWIGVLLFGTYPLNQTGQRDASLRGLARLMQRGSALLIFPQGTHSEPEQERNGDPSVRFRPGVSHLAQDLEADVIPFGIAGTEALMPAHLDRFKGLVIAGVPVSIKRGPLAIAFGPPQRIAEGESIPTFTERLQAICFSLTRDAEAALQR